jgi:hypothetical protein
MGQIAVVMMDPQHNEMGIELPDDVPIRLLLPKLVEVLGYGEGCQLYNRSQHFWYEPTDTLASHNTFEGDKLRLMER